MSYILPIAYLAPISHYFYMVNNDVTIEQCANYEKRTFANKCEIATTHGVETLTIPIEHQEHTALKDMQISAHHDWQTLHWRAIEAAYNASPFFEYYKDDLLPFYTQPQTNLFDFNFGLQQKILELLGFDTQLSVTTEYKSSYSAPNVDLRGLNYVNLKDTTLRPTICDHEYYQVFSQKLGFQPNLSIIDLLFNLGNEARLYLLEKTTCE